MVSTAFTVIDSVAVMVLLATDVAVIVAVVVAERLGGAVYTTVVFVLPLKRAGTGKSPGHTAIRIVIGNRGGNGRGLSRIQ